MNKQSENIIKSGKRKRLNTKLRDFLLMLCLATVLGLVAWKVFYTDEKVVSIAEMNETEQRISGILEQMDGVGKADVMICETEDGVQGVVVVCEGARDFQVLINIREAVSVALGTEEKDVKIYLKKE